MEPLEEELVPDHPPELPYSFGAMDPQLAEQLLQGSRVVAYLGPHLLRSAWRLVEISKKSQGRYLEGMEPPQSSRAAAAGAITLACAAFEATLNEMIFNIASREDYGLPPSTERLLRLSLKLTPRERLEALAAVCGEVLDWGTEPYQSLSLILSIRKHLLHHEAELYPAPSGHWPAKQLRDLPQRISSPYKNERLEWHQHVLSPAGAEWVVRAIYAIAGRIDLLELDSRGGPLPDIDAYLES